jgi:dipeptidyl aminopeptidase/acylaminoacyl peptidase
MTGISQTKYSSQNIHNLSFDDALKVQMVEIIGADGNLKTFNPTENYSMANFDTSSDPIYIGKTDKDGNWYIKQITVATGVVLYAVGTTGYSTAWSDKGVQSYGTFETKF